MKILSFKCEFISIVIEILILITSNEFTRTDLVLFLVRKIKMLIYQIHVNRQFLLNAIKKISKNIFFFFCDRQIDKQIIDNFNKAVTVSCVYFLTATIIFHDL